MKTAARLWIDHRKAIVVAAAGMVQSSEPPETRNSFAGAAPSVFGVTSNPPPLNHARPGALFPGGMTGDVCMRQGLTPREIACLESILYPTHMARQGDALYRANDSFQHIYMVRAGTFKTVAMHRDGREQVIGFQLAGDVLGFDGVSVGHHGQDAIALEDSNVCVIPFDLLESVCREFKGIQQYIHRLMGSEIVRKSEQMMVLGTLSAEQRIAAFLLNLSGRMKTQGYSATEFNLRMTREEIGSYLGMKLETVSRMLSKLGRDGIIDIDGKQIRILDFEGLSRV